MWTRVLSGRVAQTISLVGLLAVAGLQFIPAAPRVNPSVNPHHVLQAPGEVQSILRRSCMDCHSNQTRWPWYSKIAPISWAIASDVTRGRKAMNLSEWKTGSGRSPGLAIGYLTAMCAGVRSGRMPMEKYLLLHPEARLSRDDRDTLCAWTAVKTAQLR